MSHMELEQATASGVKLVACDVSLRDRCQTLGFGVGIFGFRP